MLIFKTILFCLLLSSSAFAQTYVDSLSATNYVTIGKAGPASTSSVLDIASTVAGALIPRMTTTQKNAIATPATGLLVYDTVIGGLFQYNGAAWKQMSSDGLSPNFAALTVGSLSGAVSAAAGVFSAGTLSVGNGGTGQISLNSTVFTPLFESIATTLGDIIYGGASGAPTRLAGNTTTNKQYLKSLGSGGLATAPTFSTIACADLSNAATSCATDATNMNNVSGGILQVGNGGTGVQTGIGDGVVFFTASGSMGSSAALVRYGVVLGGQSTIGPQTLAPNASTSLPLVSGGTGANPSWTGLTVPGGGTGQVTLTNHGVLIGAGTGAITQSAVGTTGQVLTGVTGSDPVWGSAGAGTVTSVGVSVPTGMSITNSPVTTSATMAITGFPIVAPTSVQTNTYAILTTDATVLVSGASNAYSATLPTAVGVAGKIYMIKRTDATPANTVTIATTSSQTIDGVTTRKLQTQYEQFTVISDGANWQILSHTYPQVWTAYTPTITSFGTTSNVSFFYRRVGDSIQVRGYFTAGSVAAALGTFTLPTSLVIGTMTIANTTGNNGERVGFIEAGTTAGQLAPVITATGTSTSLVYTGGQASSAANVLTPTNVGSVISNTQNCTIEFIVPISGWEG